MKYIKQLVYIQIILGLISAEIITAICKLKSDNNSNIRGQIKFRQQYPGGDTNIILDIEGLKKVQQHGFHIHEKSDIQQGCMGAGNHYNPEGKSHGGPNDEIRHEGDLGNIWGNSFGKANYRFTNTHIQLAGPFSIIGRSCVIHENSDDLGKGNTPDSPKTGNSGKRIGCGIVELVK